MAAEAPAPDFEFNIAPLRAPLSAYVEAVWAVRGHTFYNKETVLPNGNIELMLNFGTRQRVLAIGRRAHAHDHDRYWVAGLQTEPLTIESTGESNLISIRFRPGGAHALFGLPISELNDQVLDLDLILGTQVDSLRSRLAEAQGFEVQVNVIEEWLFDRLRPREYEHSLVGRALANLAEHSAGQRISDLCEQIGLSNKHMISLFRDVVGVPPKGMARILRFHQLIEEVKDKPRVDWVTLAHRFNYYDQSHLIREFRQFAGVAPSDYISRRTPDGTSLHTEDQLVRR